MEDKICDCCSKLKVAVLRIFSTGPTLDQSLVKFSGNHLIFKYHLKTHIKTLPVGGSTPRFLLFVCHTTSNCFSLPVLAQHLNVNRVRALHPGSTSLPSPRPHLVSTNKSLYIHKLAAQSTPRSGCVTAIFDKNGKLMDDRSRNK